MAELELLYKIQRLNTTAINKEVIVVRKNGGCFIIGGNSLGLKIKGLTPERIAAKYPDVFFIFLLELAVLYNN